MFYEFLSRNRLTTGRKHTYKVSITADRRKRQCDAWSRSCLVTNIPGPPPRYPFSLYNCLKILEFLKMFFLRHLSAILPIMPANWIKTSFLDPQLVIIWLTLQRAEQAHCSVSLAWKFDDPRFSLCFILFSFDAMFVCSCHSLAWLSFWTCPWLISSPPNLQFEWLFQTLVSHLQLYICSLFPHRIESDPLSLPFRVLQLGPSLPYLYLPPLLPFTSPSLQATWSSFPSQMQFLLPFQAICLTWLIHPAHFCLQNSSHSLKSSLTSASSRNLLWSPGISSVWKLLISHIQTIIRSIFFSTFQCLWNLESCCNWLCSSHDTVVFAWICSSKSTDKVSAAWKKNLETLMENSFKKWYITKAFDSTEDSTVWKRFRRVRLYKKKFEAFFNLFHFSFSCTVSYVMQDWYMIKINAYISI